MEIEPVRCCHYSNPSSKPRYPSSSWGALHDPPNQPCRDTSIQTHNLPGSDGLAGFLTAADILSDLTLSATILWVLGKSSDSEDDDAPPSPSPSLSLPLRAFCGLCRLLTGDGGKFNVDWRGSSGPLPFGRPALFFRATFMVLNRCVRSGGFFAAEELDATGIAPLRCANSAMRFARWLFDVEGLLSNDVAGRACVAGMRGFACADAGLSSIQSSHKSSYQQPNNPEGRQSVVDVRLSDPTTTLPALVFRRFSAFPPRGADTEWSAVRLRGCEPAREPGGLESTSSSRMSWDDSRMSSSDAAAEPPAQRAVTAQHPYSR